MPEAALYSAEDLRTGLKVAYDREITEEDVLAFARLSGDLNPLHVDAGYARATNYEGRIVHGAFQVALASALLGMNLPGKKVLLGSITSRFPAPLYFPGVVTVSGEITAWNLTSLGGQLRVTIQERRSLMTTAEVFMGFTLHEQRSQQMPPAMTLLNERDRSAIGSDKLVLLTGASGGLGTEIILGIGESFPILALINQRPLDSRTAHLPTVMTLQVDISQNDFEENISSAIGDRAVYAVIHAAWPGAPRGGLLQSDDPLLLNQLMFGTTVARRLAKVLFDRAHVEGGRFIAIGSTAGTIKPYLQMAAYSLGKASMEQTVRLLAPELARKKITANVVCPSFMPIGINEPATQRQVAIESAATPLSRVCEASDVVNMIRYLLSSEASFVSGQTLALTGARL